MEKSDDNELHIKEEILEKNHEHAKNIDKIIDHIFENEYEKKVMKNAILGVNAPSKPPNHNKTQSIRDNSINKLLLMDKRSNDMTLPPILVSKNRQGYVKADIADDFWRLYKQPNKNALDGLLDSLDEKHSANHDTHEGADKTVIKQSKSEPQDDGIDLIIVRKHEKGESKDNIINKRNDDSDALILTSKNNKIKQEVGDIDADKHTDAADEHEYTDGADEQYNIDTDSEDLLDADRDVNHTLKEAEISNDDSEGLMLINAKKEHGAADDKDDTLITIQKKEESPLIKRVSMRTYFEKMKKKKETITHL